MRRVQWIEIEDEQWCPKPVRDGATDYLQFVVATTQPYRAIVERLAGALERSGAQRVIDLCSGAGGPWPSLHPAVVMALKRPLAVGLTDLYPNQAVMQHFPDVASDKIFYEPIPVDATQVPSELYGFRTLFSGFHHFPPARASEILAGAVSHQQGIAIFELTDRRPLTLLTMLAVPLIILLVTPAIRPLRLSRLFFTYLLPLIPLVGLFDGIVSCLRSYTPAEMRALTQPFSEYEWETGQISVRGLAAPITYTIGTPRSQPAEVQ